MPKTQVPNRRVVTAADVAQSGFDNAEDFEPPTPRPDTTQIRNLSYKERLERRLRMADLALQMYEVKLEKFAQTKNPNDALSPEEQRLFLAHQDSVRKLEATLAQLERGDKEEEASDLSTALLLYDAGDSFDDVCQQFHFNPNLPKLLREALDERARRQL
jgi:hypothetical protein